MLYIPRRQRLIFLPTKTKMITSLVRVFHTPRRGCFFTRRPGRIHHIASIRTTFRALYARSPVDTRQTPTTKNTLQSRRIFPAFHSPDLSYTTIHHTNTGRNHSQSQRLWIECLGSNKTVDEFHRGILNLHNHRFARGVRAKPLIWRKSLCKPI